VSEQPASPPTLRLVRGDAAPEEIAALLAVLSARAARSTPATPATGPSEGRPRGGWGDRALALRSAPRLLLRPGPGAWPASGRPH
jgi:hypothetical protein